MNSKLLRRLQLAVYAALLLAAMLLDTAVFTSLRLPFVPTVMPIAVVCIGIWEGPENGAIYGLTGGLLWAWSNAMSYYGAWCIVAMTLSGTVAGIAAQRYLLQGWKTILGLSVAALIMTDGLYTIFLSFGGRLAGDAIISIFLPEMLLSLVFVAAFYPVSRLIFRIGGNHG